MSEWEWTADRIKEAVEQKQCPFCKSREFNLVVHQIRSFIFDEKGKNTRERLKTK